MKRLIVLFLLILALYGHGQVAQEIRREFPAGEEYDNFRIAPIGELGVVVFGSDKIDHSMRRWKFTLLNTKLESVDSVSIDLPRHLNYSKYVFKGNQLVYLFENIKKMVFHAVVLETKTMTLKDFGGKLPQRAVLHDMALCGSTMYLSMTDHMLALHLLALNTETGRYNINKVEVAGNKRPGYHGLEVPDGHHQALLYLRHRQNKEYLQLQAQLWNSEGAPDGVIDLSKPTDHKLGKVNATLIGPDHFVFVGSFSPKSASLNAGLFVLEVEKGKRKYIEYYNFMDLQNFTSYLPKMEKSALDRKKSNAARKDKELYVDFRMVEHNIVHVNGRYYFLAEFYYPTEKSQTTTKPSGSGTVTTKQMVFDGNQYTHATLICFDSMGQKLWDHTIEMKLQFKPYNVVKFFSMRISSSGKVDLNYSNITEIYWMSVDSDGEELSKPLTIDIETKGEDDQVRRMYTVMEYWYGDAFIAYGQQTITDKGKTKGSRTRKVYYVNKISPQ